MEASMWNLWDEKKKIKKLTVKAHYKLPIPPPNLVLPIPVSKREGGPNTCFLHDMWSQPPHFSRATLHTQSQVLSTPFYIHVVPAAHDWIASMWLTGMLGYISPTLKALPVLFPWLSLPMDSHVFIRKHFSVVLTLWSRHAIFWGLD